jgi:hypothetical protein
VLQIKHYTSEDSEQSRSRRSIVLLVFLRISLSVTVEFFIPEYTLYTVAVSLLRGSKERC